MASDALVPCTAMQVINGLGIDFFDGLVQNCSNSRALAMELLQSCTKPLI